MLETQRPHELLRKGGLAVYDVSYHKIPPDPVLVIDPSHQIGFDTQRILKIDHDEPHWRWEKFYPSYYIALPVGSNDLQQAVFWSETRTSIMGTDLLGINSFTIERLIDQRSDNNDVPDKFDEIYGQTFKDAIATDDKPEETIRNLEAAELFRFGPFPNLMKDPKYRDESKPGWMIHSPEEFAGNIAAWIPLDVFFSTWYGQSVNKSRIALPKFLEKAIAKI